MARIFISYSHQDEAWKERLVSHLGVLRSEGLEVWEDRQIAGGDDWRAAIEQAIGACDVALLLVSRHFLNSDFIQGEEVPKLLERRGREGVRVIPVILAPCQWHRVSWLQPLQARPKDGAALSGMTEAAADDALSALAGEVHDLTGHRAPDAPPSSVAVSIHHLPAGTEYFLGRTSELATLDAAWVDDGSAVVELIAPGGVGKSALVHEWLGRLRMDGWRGARRVYGWSFYSQGTSEDRQASEDHFLAEALKWFGVAVADSADPWEKGQRLAEAVAAGRTLLVLDGVEPLQYPPGPLAGELRAPGLKTLLEHLAGMGQPGLCLVTSRERLEDLNGWERNATRPHGSVRRLNLGELDEADGARLLHALGVNRAGPAAIGPEDAELKETSRAVQGHALTLALLGHWLYLAYGGDVRRRDQADLAAANAEVQGGHAFRVMAAYERWFAREGEQGARELAALRLLGFFDRPATPESLAALRAAPAIKGLTEPLFQKPSGRFAFLRRPKPLPEQEWTLTQNRLRACGLLYPAQNGAEGSLDAHPLVREYLARRLAQEQPAAWREGHRRLYEQLKASVPHRPEGLAALQPLYQAVAHGCLAGQQQEACAEVYRDRILRGTGDDGFYSTKQLGAFGADLGAVACFFEQPWQRPAPALSEAYQAWLLNAAAFRLRALGRLEEALEPMAAGAQRAAQQQDWKNAAANYNNLSELHLTLGHTRAALAAAEQSLAHAERSGDAFLRMAMRTALADALHQHGAPEAEALQAQRQPDYPLLYSLQGFQYADLLLAGAERAAWRGPGEEAPRQRCREVAQRAAQTLAWAEKNRLSLLTIALDHLTLARCALYSARLQGQPPAAAVPDTERAVTGLRAAGHQEFIPHALLTRAWLRHTLGDLPGSRADLAEVHRIASRGNMRLHLADYHLHHARLFPDDPDARDHLTNARALIEQCEYLRRLPELEDAEAKLKKTLTC